MISMFRDPLHERLGSWPLAYISDGGADFGEIAVIADAVGDGDDDAFQKHGSECTLIPWRLQ